MNSAVSFMDPARLVGTVDPAATAAMLQNAGQIREENEQLLANLYSGQPNPNLGVTNNEEFAQYASNVDRLADVVATQAVQQGVLSPQQVSQISRQAGVPINTNAAPLALTPAQQQQAARLEQQMQRQRQQTQQQLQQNQQQNQTLLNEITNRQQQQSQQNQQAQNRIAQQAEQNYVSRLNEEQRQQFNQNKTQINTPAPVVTTPPVTTPPVTTPPVVTPVPPVVTLVTPAGHVNIGDSIVAGSSLPGTLYLVPENINASVSAFEAAVSSNTAKKAIQQSVPSSVTFSTAGLPAGNYVVFAVANGANGISAKSSVYNLVVAVPTKPESVTFVDTDSSDGKIGGTVRIARAMDEKYVTGYQLYWGNAVGDILANASTGGLIANVSKTGTSSYVEYAIPNGTSIPSGAGTILAFSVNGAVKSVNAAWTSLIDLKPVPGNPSAPRGIEFIDMNPAEGKLSGTVRIFRALDESNLTGYELHWGDANGNLLGASSFIASVNKAGAAEYAIYEIPGDLTIPNGAKKLIAFSANGSIRLDAKAEIDIHDSVYGAYNPYVAYEGVSLMKEGKVSLQVTVNKPATLYVMPMDDLIGTSPVLPNLETLIVQAKAKVTVGAGRTVIEPTLPVGRFVIYAADADGNISYPSRDFYVVDKDAALSSITGKITLPQSVSHPVTLAIEGYLNSGGPGSVPYLSYVYVIVPAGSKEASFTLPVYSGDANYMLQYFLYEYTSETERWVPYNILAGTYAAGSSGVQVNIVTGVKLSGDVSVSAENRDSTKPVYVVLRIRNETYDLGHRMQAVPGGSPVHYEFVVPQGDGYQLSYNVPEESSFGKNDGDLTVPSLTGNDVTLDVTVPGKQFYDPYEPRLIEFNDIDTATGRIAGTVKIIGNNFAQSGIVLYWGDGEGNKLPGMEPIATIQGAGIVSYLLPAVTIPTGAESLVAFTVNGPKTSVSSVYQTIVDLVELEKTSASLSDSNPLSGKLSGNIEIIRGAEDQAATSFRLYWGTPWNTKASETMIAETVITGNYTNYSLDDAAIPAGAANILAYPIVDSVEASVPRVSPIYDDASESREDNSVTLEAELKATQVTSTEDGKLVGGDKVSIYFNSIDYTDDANLAAIEDAFDAAFGVEGVFTASRPPVPELFYSVDLVVKAGVELDISEAKTVLLPVGAAGNVGVLRFVISDALAPVPSAVIVGYDEEYGFKINFNVKDAVIEDARLINWIGETFVRAKVDGVYYYISFYDGEYDTYFYVTKMSAKPDSLSVWVAAEGMYAPDVLMSFGTSVAPYYDIKARAGIGNQWLALDAYQGDTPNDITIQWSGITNAAKYEVYLNGLKQSETEYTFYSFENQSPGEKQIDVKALDENGGIIASQSITYFLIPSIEGFEYHAEENSIAWTPVDGAVKYVLESDAIGYIPVEVSANEYNFESSLSVGTGYSVYIGAVDALGATIAEGMYWFVGQRFITDFQVQYPTISWTSMGEDKVEVIYPEFYNAKPVTGEGPQTYTLGEMAPGTYDIQVSLIKNYLVIARSVATITVPEVEPDHTPPTVVYLGTSTVVVKNEWNVYVSEPGRLYVGRSDVISDEMASDGFDLSDLENVEAFTLLKDVDAGVNTIPTDAIEAGDSYQFIAVDENGNLSVPSEKFWTLSAESTVKTISGTVTLPEASGPEGAIIKIVAKQSDYNAEYHNVWIKPGEDTASYSVIIVDGYSNYSVGYEVMSPDSNPVRWVASWVLLDSDGVELRFPPDSTDINVSVQKGALVSGTIELSAQYRDPDAEAVVVVTVDNGQLNVTKAFSVLPGQPIDYSMVVPFGTEYTLQYNMAGETNVWFYTSSGTGYTSNPYDAEPLVFNQDSDVTTVDLIVPAKTDNVTGIQVTRANLSSIALKFDLYQPQTKYRLDLYKGSVMLDSDIRITPSDQTAVVVEAGDIALDTTLAPNVEYKLVVTAYGLNDSDYMRPIGSGFVKFTFGSDIHAMADVYAKSAVVKWNPVFGADSYRLTVNNGMPFTIGKSEWELVDLIPETDYSVVIESVGGTTQSKTIAFTTPSTANPTVTEATYGYNETFGPVLIYNVTWDAVPGAVNYKVTFNGISSIVTNLTTTTLENVKYGQANTIEVIALDIDGAVVSRDKQQWVTESYAEVPDVAIYSGSDGPYSWMDIEWSEYSGATEYRVFVDGVLYESVTDLANLYCELEGVSFGHMYMIRIEAWNGGTMPAAVTEMPHIPYPTMYL
ncbi:hypothetical protein [Paenibacillus thermotolerans]|uniref:hypothetical protein n=1 Tax=Paenibacillus thermotolerans TaxID=3027807 RepID=UPI0023674EEA|nr:MULTISPECIES: hypothetical protein [unclassified Paenibacillus]